MLWKVQYLYVSYLSLEVTSFCIEANVLHLCHHAYAIYVHAILVSVCYECSHGLQGFHFILPFVAVCDLSHHLQDVTCQNPITAFLFLLPTDEMTCRAKYMFYLLISFFYWKIQNTSSLFFQRDKT